jgi:outer membrane immunogenic protein
MKMLTRTFVYILLGCSLSLMTMAQTPGNTIDASVMFSELRGNAPVGGCGCFWMAGGTGEIAIPVWRNFSFVAEGGGNHTDTIPGTNVGLGLVLGLGGVRLRVPNHTKFQPFGQALFGGVHGFDSYFPVPVGKLPTTYDTSFAMAIGGGVDLAISRHIWIRVLQADYNYSELRNIQGDRQNQLRLGAGIVFRGAGK